MNIDIPESKKSRCCTLLIAVLSCFLVTAPDLCLADRGGWYVSTEPVTLKESGQRAIIGWDGEIQILCLATDVSSSKKTTVIEFLPLPSEPKVTLGNRQSFEAVQKVLDRLGVRFFKAKGRLGKGLRAGGDEAEPFRITFHQKLGAHDVTVVKVNQPDKFVDWIEEKARAITANQTAVPDSLRKLVAKYLNEYKCPYFVFDVIEVGPDPKSVEPIIYEFRYPLLFYPLEISSTFHGQTSIDLIVFSENLLNQDPFWDLDFQLSSATTVNAADLNEVLPRLKELLGETAWIQAFRYKGDIRNLTGNIKAGLRRDNLAYTSGQYKRGQSTAFYKGVAGAIYAGVIITFVSLWPLYFAAKRQQPRWTLRMLAGFLLGMPIGLLLIVTSMNVLHALGLQSQFFRWTHYYYSANPATLIACSMGMGFIIFCFQLGLRRQWYLWGLLYAALAIPATFIVNPARLEDIFAHSHWRWLSGDLRYIFLPLLIVFVLLFLSARLIIWITGLWKRDKRSPTAQSAQ
ncbi:MAG: hypothetical protein ACYSW4_05355 [Planctomycetota bacterium]|jgi:hypothetical protein